MRRRIHMHVPQLQHALQQCEYDKEEEQPRGAHCSEIIGSEPVAEILSEQRDADIDIDQVPGRIAAFSATDRVRVTSRECRRKCNRPQRMPV